MAKRESWGSRVGFIFAAAGSAIGLANIWRFPYVVGKHGGAAFVLVYLIFLALIGFPVLLSEILIGRTAETSPSGAFERIGGKKGWSWIGKMTIATGFIVSAFYSAVAGWILGYLVEAVSGRLNSFESCHEPSLHYECLMQNAWWGLSFHSLFLVLCIGVLYGGVRQGIERANKWLLPLLYGVLLLLVFKGLSMPNAAEGIKFLFHPDWSLLTPTAIMIALGQAFFTLSLGQGTMATYGSYLGKGENVIKTCLPVVLMDTAVSLLSAVAVFTIVFATEMEPSSGPGLLFHTLPWAFSQIPGGYIIAVLFFLLTVLAALTSEISAMEPTIAYLIDEWKWKRAPAVACCGLGVFLLGIPSALSFNLLSSYTFNGKNFLELMEVLCSNLLIPLGGLFAVVLVGWVWGVPNALKELQKGGGDLLRSQKWIKTYLWFCLKYAAPVLILLIFLNALGVFL